MSEAGRLVVVTGGAKGIGRALVAAFAAAGDRVVVTGRDAAALEDAVRALGDSVTCELCDVSDERRVAELFEALGPVDVLVNNAGVSTSAPLVRTRLDDWRQQLDVNATGAFLCTPRRPARHGRAGGPGASSPSPRQPRASGTGTPPATPPPSTPRSG